MALEAFVTGVPSRYEAISASLSDLCDPVWHFRGGDILLYFEGIEVKAFGNTNVISVFKY